MTVNIPYLYLSGFRDTLAVLIGLAIVLLAARFNFVIRVS